MRQPAEVPRGAYGPPAEEGVPARRAAVGGFLGSLVAIGSTIYLFGVFQDALVEAFDTSVATLSFGPSLFTAVSGILSPVVGRSLATPSRPGVSVRAVMFVGALSLGVGFVLLSRANSLPIAALVFTAMIAPGAILMGPLLGQALVTSWFDAERGRMLGIVSAGTTVGGMLMPPLAASLIGALGWRDAMAAIGLLATLVMLPAIALLVRDRPAPEARPDRGRSATSAGGGGQDARAASPEGAAIAEPEPEIARSASTRELLRDPQLWLVGLTFGLIFSAGMVSTIFMVPFATETGIPLLAGSLVAGARAGFAAGGKIVFGALADRVGVRNVLWGVVASEAILTAWLVQTRDPRLFVALFVAIGFVGGAPLPLKAAMAGELFGRANFAGSMGLLQTLAAPFQLLIVPIGGYVYTVTGTYAAVFLLTIPCFVLGGLLPLLLRSPAQVRENAP